MGLGTGMSNCMLEKGCHAYTTSLYVLSALQEP